jgi:hypothetical protein
MPNPALLQPVKTGDAVPVHDELLLEAAMTVAQLVDLPPHVA